MSIPPERVSRCMSVGATLLAACPSGVRLASASLATLDKSSHPGILPSPPPGFLHAYGNSTVTVQLQYDYYYGSELLLAQDLVRLGTVIPLACLLSLTPPSRSPLYSVIYTQ
ncbi:hypothetical protein FB451DRAFT_1187925 [Mycena latifolia]|nr:hypothetical protein FB451DRAFT_1187925 [Mycena latifolia]